MRPAPRIVLVLLGLGMLWPTSRAPGQVILIDRRPEVSLSRSYEIREVIIDGRVLNQVAEVQVSQTFHNPGSRDLEAEFLFPLPEDGAIESLTLLADGKELPGRLLDKDEARRIYEEIVRRKRDPALLEYMGRGLYRTSVFPIPPHADRTVTIRYTQLLRREADLIEFVFPFATQKFTAKPIERLEFRLRIASETPIKSLYSPGHELEINRDGDHEATIKLVRRDVTPTADLRLIYTVKEGDVGATVLSYRPSASEDGYFMLLASPRVEADDADRRREEREKTVIFVLDRSGSMSGKKIEQARDSLKFVLDNLRDGDLFNILVYDDRVEAFKPELQRYDSERRREATRYVENIRPGGSTNIDEALTQALDMVPDDDRPSYVLFLTDGLPTVGERDEADIARNAREANDEGARVFSFGVGYDVNARLLDRLSRDHGGTSEYVRPDEDLEAHVARFFAKLTSPVLTDLDIRLSGTDVNRTYPRDLPDLFEGGQLVWVGRYRDSGSTRVEINGKVGGSRRSVTTEAELADPGEGRRYAFVERLWAIRRVGDILDQIDLHGENRELTEELVRLSKQHGILTPYTSFLADETTDLNATSVNRERARRSLESFGLQSGAQGVGQRLNKRNYQAEQQVASGFAPAAPAASEPATLAATPPADASAGQYSTSESLARAPRRDSVETFARAAPSSSQSRGEGMGGMAGPGNAPGRLALQAPAQQGQAAIARDLEGREQVIGTVRNIGSKTFFRRGDRWVDSEVTPEEETRAVVLEQYSDAYFRLARTQGPEQNQYLTFTEPVTVELDGTVYRIVPATN